MHPTFTEPADFVLSLYQSSKGKPSEPIPPFIMPGSGACTNGKALAQWLAAYQPEAVIGTAGEALQWLIQIGRAIPKNVSYADLYLSSPLPGEIAGTCEMHEAVASSAVDLVVEQLNANHAGTPMHPKAVLIEGIWIDGCSLPVKRDVA